MKEAFEAIYEKYAGLVYSRCLWYIRDSEAARDMVHDIFLQVLKNMHLFENLNHHHAMLYRMSTNACINYLKKHRRSVHLDFLKSTIYSDDSVQQSNTENKIDLQRILKLFDKTSSAIAWLYFVEGHTQEQVAGLMQVSRKTVNRKIMKIKKKLGLLQ